MTKAITRPSRAAQQDESATPGKFAEVQMTYDEIAAHYGITKRAVTYSHDAAILKLWKLAEDPQLMAMFSDL